VKLMSGGSDANIEFADLCGYLKSLGFAERISGDHHILRIPRTGPILTLQPGPGGKAKAYQVKQARAPGQAGTVRQEMENYKVVIWWSDEDAAFVAEMPELPGCMADGKTREEALAAIQEAAALWIDTAKLDGREIPIAGGHSQAAAA
jgi:predicted RNase H-like HicB family nuclease